MCFFAIFLQAMIGQVRMDPEVERLYDYLTPEQQVARKRVQQLGGIVIAGEQGYYVSLLTFRGPKFADDELPLLAPFRGTSVYSIGFVTTRNTDFGIAKALRDFPNLKSV